MNKVVYGKRYLATTSLSSLSKIVIIGGGAAGISVASQLLNLKNNLEIVIIEPSKTHAYQPLWTFVGGGIKTLDSSLKPMKQVIPKGAQWMQDSVVRIHPESNALETSQGQQVGYDVLIVASGIQKDWSKIPGLSKQLIGEGVCSIYESKGAVKTYDLIRSLKGGNAIFTQPSTPIKCAGAPQKIAYLAEELFTKHHVRSKTNVSFYTGMPKIFAIEKYAKSLLKVCKQRDIHVHLQHDVVQVDTENKLVTFKTPNQEKLVKSYDLLHVVPPMSAPSFIKESGLGNADGWVNVNKETTQHVKYPNVFSLGDSSSLPTSKTAAAVAAQSIVTCKNVVSFVESKDFGFSYDGYTSCPLITGRNKLILAEFSGYDGKPRETFSFDQSQESAVAYQLTANILPTVYWEWMLKGKWNGPSTIRKILNPFNKN